MNFVISSLFFFVSTSKKQCTSKKNQLRILNENSGKQNRQDELCKRAIARSHKIHNKMFVWVCGRVRFDQQLNTKKANRKDELKTIFTKKTKRLVKTLAVRSSTHIYRYIGIHNNLVYLQLNSAIAIHCALLAVEDRVKNKVRCFVFVSLFFFSFNFSHSHFSANRSELNEEVVGELLFCVQMKNSTFFFLFIFFHCFYCFLLTLLIHQNEK